MDLTGKTSTLRKAVLNEYESKIFLSRYGIPVIQESLVTDVDSAVAEAEGLGFPVVLKVAGEKLAHKTEVGGVVLNLRSESDVWEEGSRLLTIQGCQGLLVQKMASGHRELVCGLVRDPQYGPCVMFGLGGVLTEALNDVVFRMAPLSVQEAREMVREIRGSRVLGSFRGEPQVDFEALAQILVRLGEIGLQQEEVLEIDINPLKIQADGSPVAVDALVVLIKDGE